MKHVMQDIETWGTGPTALPVSIGAVRFDGDTIIDRFSVGIDPVEAQRYAGFTIDADTIMWWFSPERDAARKLWLDMPKVDLFAALDGFFMWCNEVPRDERGSLWGNGSMFDNTIVRNACKITGAEYPVSYSKDECYRTIKNRMGKAVPFVRLGVYHNAVDDAESQAVHLQAIAKHHGFEL